ncbi:MAG: hypothetical protein H6Q71_2103, partial [Firmicutes bacterium]|nr:hypothetical protein [Bacillota bacterium]
MTLAIEQVKAGYIEKNQLLGKMNDKIDLAEFEYC